MSTPLYLVHLESNKTILKLFSIQSKSKKNFSQAIFSSSRNQPFGQEKQKFFYFYQNISIFRSQRLILSTKKRLSVFLLNVARGKLNTFHHKLYTTLTKRSSFKRTSIFDSSRIRTFSSQIFFLECHLSHLNLRKICYFPNGFL